VRFHHHVFATNLMTNLLAKLPHKQMLHNFFISVGQKFVANQICLPQTQLCEFVSEFVSKFVAKMLLWKRTLNEWFVQFLRVFEQEANKS
jgi:hypothetical protein